MSLPARGVWIEIGIESGISPAYGTSLPARGVWIEIALSRWKARKPRSLPARGVWIEMPSARPSLTHR